MHQSMGTRTSLSVAVDAVAVVLRPSEDAELLSVVVGGGFGAKNVLVKDGERLLC